MNVSEIGIAFNNIVYPMLNEGDTALPFKQYKGTLDTFPISAELRAFLEDKGYGKGINAECCNHIDFERKVFVPKVHEVDLGALEWRKQQTDNRFITSSLPLPSKPYNINTKGVCICSLYDVATWSEVNTAAVSEGIAIYESQVYIVDTKHNDLETFQNAMRGVKLIYELATPMEEIDISTYLDDDNFIEVEGGGVIKAVNEHNYDVPTTIAYVSQKGS
jgi:hypothetical protein